MDESRILQSLDSLWFYSNIFTHPSTPSIHPKEPPKSDLQAPNSLFLSHLQEEYETVESVIPFPPNPKPCEPETQMKDKGGGRRRRKRKNRPVRNGATKIAVELGFDTKVVTGPFKLDRPSWTLPYHDEMAMKEHLKSWAYAVACIVR